MAGDQQTLDAANGYTDDQIAAHEAAANPHPAYVQLTDIGGQPTGGRLISLPAGAPVPAVEAGSILFTTAGIFIPNEAGTAWAELGVGPLPADTTPPTTPGNFRTVSKTTTSITVAWDASTDTETGVGGYDVSIDSGSFVSLGNVLTYTFEGLGPGTTHVMRVRARDRALVPNRSTTATRTDSTTAATIGVPTNLRTTAVTTTAITFAWDPPIDRGVPVTRYEWRLAGGTFATNGVATTKQVTGLTQDSPYTFGVRAVFSDGNVSSEVTLNARTSPTTPITGPVLIGLHIGSPPVSASDVANWPAQLGPYNNLSQLETLKALEAEMRGLAGFSDDPLMSVGHVFQAGSNYLLKSWGTQQLARMPVLVANFKPAGGSTTAAMQRTASGAEDNLIQALIDSLPVGKRVYLTYFHEPDETAGAFATAWRAASAHWAKYILDHRGTKDLHPMVCQTTFSFRPANASTQAQFLSVTDDYEALGIDWRTQVVMGPDGYEDSASSANGDAAITFENVFPTLYARGWRRFGITETATGSHVGQSGNNTVTAADVTASVPWARSLVKYAVSYNMEYVCWFCSTGSKAPVGSWMFTDAIKQAWGQAAHYKGPAPGW